MHSRIPASSKTGNTTANKIPAFKLSSIAPEIIPTSVVPPEHPRSPPSASSANIAVPPAGSDAAALLKVPGHRMPTDRPQMAQAIRLTAGTGTKTIVRYDAMHKMLLPAIKRSRLSRSPNFP